jgi:hypothetical protein
VATKTDITAKLPGSLTPRQARDARACAWAYVFECFHSHTEKKAACGSGPDDGTKVKEDSANEHRST